MVYLLVYIVAKLLQGLTGRNKTLGMYHQLQVELFTLFPDLEGDSASCFLRLLYFLLFFRL